MHVRVYVGMYRHVAHRGVMSMYSDRCHAYRWVHVDSIAILSSKCIFVCMDIHQYLDTCTLERQRDAGVGVRLWRVRARVKHPREWTSASGCNRRSECTGVSITRMRVCVRACVATFHGFGPFDPTSAHCCAAGAAARARGARQAHQIHEGEGAPRMARPVQALRGSVRPADCVCGGAGAAPLRVRCRAGRWGRAARRWMRRRRRCWSSAGPSPRAHGWRARPTGAREGRAGAARRGRTGAAQVRDRLRARGAAGGGRVAEVEVLVSAPAAALTPAPPTRGGRRAARSLDVHD